jgi:hypothetical protein
MNIQIKPARVDGEEFLTVSQMAVITNRSAQTIYTLVKKGNVIRKMKSKKIIDRVLIPITEVEEFPFTNTGRNCQDEPYYYTKKGVIE